jgi:hypothetical protein
MRQIQCLKWPPTCGHLAPCASGKRKHPSYHREMIVKSTLASDERSFDQSTRIYRLTPIDTRNPNWRGSVHRDVAVVRAGSEDLARALAAGAFNSALLPSTPGRAVPITLWERPDAVRAEIVDDDRYRPAGAIGILEPWGFS